MQLRNAILIALAFDANPQEIEAAHDAIDRQFGGGVNPEYIVSKNVAGQPSEPAVTQESETTATETTDKDGLPWDERIHASSKALTEKGVWRAKRGVDSAMKEKIEAQLKGAVTATAPAAPAAAPAAPAAPALPPPPGATAVNPAYAELVQFIASNTNSDANPSGRITADWLKQVLTHYQVPEGSLQNLAHAPQIVGAVNDYLRSALA